MAAAAGARIAGPAADFIARLQALEQQHQQQAAMNNSGPSVSIKPETFSGAPSEDVRRWLERFALLREANGWQENRARATLAVHLTGPAEAWLVAQPAQRVDTLAHLTAALLEDFAPVNDGLHLRDRLMSRYQGPEEPVEAYAAAILDLCRQLNANLPGADKCAYLLHGLQPALKEHLLVTLPNADNVSDLIKAARTKQQAMRAASTGQVHAVTDTTSLIRDLAADMRRVLNRVDSLAERVSQLEVAHRQAYPSRRDDNLRRWQDNNNNGNRGRRDDVNHNRSFGGRQHEHQQDPPPPRQQQRGGQGQWQASHGRLNA